jgi:hypothetical protein
VGTMAKRNRDRMGHRPRCRHCGKRLLKHTYSWWPGVGYGHRPEVGCAAEEGRVVEIIRTKPLNDGYAEPRVRITYWCGEWGYYGNELFCSLRCGYVWAVRTLKQGGTRA